MRKKQKKKVVLYARASTVNKPFDKDGAQIQIARLLEYANKQGYQVSGVYFDNGFGGRVLRPQLVRMISEIESKSVEAKSIICVSTDQYSRYYFKLLQLLQRINSAGAEFEFLEEVQPLTNEKRKYNKKKQQ